MSFARINASESVRAAHKRWSALLTGLAKGVITLYPYDRRVDGLALDVGGELHIIRDITSDTRIADAIGRIVRKYSRQAQSQEEIRQIAHLSETVGYAVIALDRIRRSVDMIRSVRM